MYDFEKIVALSMIVLSCCGTLARAEDEVIGSALASGKDGIALVSVKVSAVDKNRGEGTLKITHVYSGAKSLKGLGLFDLTADNGDGGSLAIPLLEVGETGLWILAMDENTGTWFTAGRYRKDYTVNYEQRVEWATMIEKLVKLKVAKRLDFAQELCEHKNPEIAELGVQVLCWAKTADAEHAGITQILIKIATDRRQTDAVRRVVVKEVIRTGIRPDFTFDILTAVVRLGADDASRLTATKGLARFKWANRAQLDVLRGLLKAEKDAEVAKALGEAIDKVK